MTMQERKLRKALKLAGGPKAFANLLGISSQAVSQWKKTPGNRVLDLEAATDGQVTRFELRPDIFGKG